MSDTLITVIAVGLSAVLMFVLPVIAMADRVDTISQIDVEAITSEFINDVKTAGKLTIEKYSEFLENLTADRKYI